MSRLILFFLFLMPFLLQAQDDFEHSPKSPHYLVVLPKSGWADMGDMVGGFAKYHAKEYTEKQYSIKQYRLKAEDKMPFVLVGIFENETEAFLYYQKLQTPLVAFLQMGVATDYFILSAENYNRVILQKGFTEYRKYFESKYPN
ncbi:MAG: hypothetical protein ACI85O_001467 [Saprospiraceae bacterium]|jgi:hypothetical protein